MDPGRFTTDTGTTGITLMGVRLYTPTTGRFLTTDPIHGGNPNTYTYPVDPIGDVDLDGRMHYKNAGGGGGGLLLVVVLWSARTATRVARPAVTAAARTQRTWARNVVNHWDRGTFPNRLQSLKYHHAKHGAPGQSLKDYATQGVKLSKRVGATGKTTRVRGPGGGIVSPRGRTYTTW